MIAYHGCDATTAERLFAGEAFAKSRNDYDWLGTGTYFWEYGADRAMRFAEAQVKRGRFRAPAVVGALIQLGRCFDLMDTKFTRELRGSYKELTKVHERVGAKLPVNGGSTPDKELRRLDCAVLELYLGTLELRGVGYDTVRCAFVEGDPAFDGSGIQEHSHVQVAVRNAACIIGVFPAHTRGGGVMNENRDFKPTLDPEAPGLDEMTRKRRRVLAELEAMSAEEVFRILVELGIYTEDGELTEPYRDDAPAADVEHRASSVSEGKGRAS